jgi:dTDP-4-dehydrorhamnose reductase
MDVSNRDHVRIQLAYHKPSIIVHTAGMTSLEKCEKHPKQAMLSNAVPSIFLTEYADPEALIIYVSTGQVFGLNGGQMPEEYFTQFKPTNMYATSKYYGEVFLLHTRQKRQRIVIIRTSWLFGRGGEKFTDRIINDLVQNKPIAAVEDMRGAPTYARDLAYFIRHIIEHQDKLFEENVLHFTNQDTASRYDVAISIKEYIGSHSIIEPVPNDYFSSPVKRPSREYLSMEHTMSLFPDFLYRDWNIALRDYLIELNLLNEYSHETQH